MDGLLWASRGPAPLLELAVVSVEFISLSHCPGGMVGRVQSEDSGREGQNNIFCPHQA